LTDRNRVSLILETPFPPATFRVEGLAGVGEEPNRRDPLVKATGEDREEKPAWPARCRRRVHKAFVDVNEVGTEAAAATAVIPLPAAPVEKREEPVVFRADHPFVFLVRDSRTGAVLFLGRMSDPKK